MARLLPHPDNGPGSADLAVSVAVSFDADRLHLEYTVEGDWSRLAVPLPAGPRRVDGLWRHTCFEAFIAGAADPYVEFNCAPSGAFAAYRFAAYRRERSDLHSLTELPIATNSAPAQFRLEAAIDLKCLAGVLLAPFALGLAAVLEDRSGALSYFALAHPPGRPDFHDRRGFVLQVGSGG
jgi:hypothetical protein